MEIVPHSAKVWGLCPLDQDETLRWIEKAARTCYNSRDKITENSAKPFVEQLVRKGHYSILEHSCKALFSPCTEWDDDSRFLRRIPDTSILVGSWLAWCYQWKQPPGIVWKGGADERDSPLWRCTVEFETDRAISHQLVRHRPASFLQMSQRYVDHSKPRVIEGAWTTIPSAVYAVEAAFETYRGLRRLTLRPEQARAVLPNCTATRIVMTTTVEHLQYIVNLRTTSACDPSMRALMASLVTELEKEDWWDACNSKKRK